MSWKSWSYFKGIMEPLLVFVETSAPVSGLIIFLGLQEADDTFFMFSESTAS